MNTRSPILRNCRPLFAALGLAGLLVPPSHAVRLNADGHGQVLVYPYYTARSLSGGNAFVTALTVINTSAAPKAVKVRFLEGKTGAAVNDFNLFLSGYDTWTAAVVASGGGAGMFTSDKSCTSPTISRSGASPTRFSGDAYAGDGLGDSLDRTLEGYFEILEMGAIAPASPFGTAVTHVTDYSAPGISTPTCVALPTTTELPPGLSKPTGGLIGSVNFINVNEGTDFSIDAIALTQWSDRVQWSPAGSAHPNLADASPAVSTTTQSSGDADLMVTTRWNSGRDAVSAVFMADRIRNEYSVEPGIKAATDWILTMPTRRFHVSAASAEAPFVNKSNGLPQPPNRGEPVLLLYYDREEQSPGAPIDFGGVIDQHLYYATSTFPFIRNSGSVHAGTVLGGTNLGPYLTGVPVNATWLNGWGELALGQMLIAPAGMSSLTDTLTGALVSTSSTVTYFGLPIVGFAVQSYSTTGLPGISPNVLSNYGVQFANKVGRRISIAP